MKPLAIAGVALRRLIRDRTSIFFVFIFPFLIILAIGATFGSGFTPKLGVVAAGSGPLGEDLVRRLDRLPSMEVRRLTGPEELRAAVERGQVEAGLIVPGGYDATVRTGGEAPVRYLARPGSIGQQLQHSVASAVDEQGWLLRAARFAERQGAATFDAALERAGAVRERLPAVTVRVTTLGTPETDVGRFDLGAANNLVLFMFVTSLGAASQVIETRTLGVARRMLATPTAARSVIAGETLARFSVALLQGLVIVFVSLLAFGVDWGDPLGAGALVVLFALVGTGAAMLLGSILDNAQQAGSLGVFFGLGMAALGGAMVPLEVFPDTMRRIAHVTPHAWALEGFGELIARGGGLGDIVTQMAVLAGYAAVLLALAIRLFRRTITE